MSLCDEINRVAKTSAEYDKEQEQKAKTARREEDERNGKRLIYKLEVLLKEAASKGKINRGRLSGTLTFDNKMTIKDDGPDGFQYVGANLPPHTETRRVHRGLGIFVNEEVDKITVTPTQAILGAYEVLKEFAYKENITLSDLYIIDSDGCTYNSTKVTVADKKFGHKTFVYAVDYSMMV